jgi:GNAT superfamily N-acetyltransferase
VLETKLVNTASDHPQAWKLLQTAFPKSEQMPVGLLGGGIKRGVGRLNSYWLGGEFVGLSYTVTHDDLTLLQYLAVADSHRNVGIGSQILAVIDEEHRGSRIALDAEAVLPELDAATNELRRRRHDFYRRNGYTMSPQLMSINRNRLNVMTKNGHVTVAELRKLFGRFWGPIINLFIGPREVRNAVG